MLSLVRKTDVSSLVEYVSSNWMLEGRIVVSEARLCIVVTSKTSTLWDMYLATLLPKPCFLLCMWES